MAYNIGPRIGIDGEREYRRQLSEIIASTKALDAELKALTSSYDDNAATQEDLEAVAETLRRKMEAQTDALARITKLYEAAKTETGASSETTQRWAAAMYNAEAALNETRGKLDETTARIEEMGDRTEEAGDAMDDASDSALDFGDVLKASLASQLITKALGKLADLGKDFASGMVTSAAELNASTAQFEQTFGGASEAARTNLRKISDEAGVAVTRMQGGYTQIYAFAKTAGSESAQAMDIASRAMAAATDSAAYYDRSIEDTTKSLQAFLKGNYANDAALGISATETTRNAAANKLYAKSFRELTEAQKVDVLLSMVEAGNKASGAFGQAAREADGWENVTGNLQDAWTRLQATLGKPVLEQTTKAVQTLTEKLNQAADSGALDELAEKIGNSLGWIIENGDEVATTAGIIAVSFVGLKVALNAAEWIDKLKIAIAAMDKASAAASAHPVALATALASMGAYLLISEDRLDGLGISAIRAAKDVQQAAADIDAAFAASVSEADAAAKTAEHYIQRLDELAAGGLGSASAQGEYNETIAQLNKLIPSLNARIDEQTGLVEGGTAALRRNTAEWRENVKAQAEAERLKDLYKALEDAKAKLQGLQSDDVDWRDVLLKGLVPAVGGIRDGVQQLSALKIEDQIKEYEAAIEAFGASSGDAAAEVAAVATASSDAADAVDGLTDAAQKSARANMGLNKTLKELKAEEFTRLRTEYEALYDTSLASINGQIDMLTDLSEATAQSTADMLEVWSKQTEAMLNYSDNLLKAKAMGISAEIIAQLSDGSTQSMAILDNMVNDQTATVDEINASWARLSDSKEAAAKAMRDVQYAIRDELDSMGQDIYEYARTDGYNIVNGLVDGVEKYSWQYRKAMRELAERGQEEFRVINRIQSPSRVYRTYGQYNVEGAILGIEDLARDYAEAVRRLGESGIDNMEQTALYAERIGAYVPYIPPTAKMATGGASSTNITLGGITLNVNAPSVTNVEQLAELVAQKIYDGVQREVATYAG